MSGNPGQPIARRMAAIAAASANVYGPDGVPLDGPRTTAAYYADLFGVNIRPTRDRLPIPPAMWRAYRAAADHEAAAWAHAVREGRAMRTAAYRSLPYQRGGGQYSRAYPDEIANGCPTLGTIGRRIEAVHVSGAS